jgi:hypothetical protein
MQKKNAFDSFQASAREYHAKDCLDEPELDERGFPLTPKNSEKAKLTNGSREWGLAQLDVLARLINEGKWDYSISKLKQEHGAYSFFTWTEVHPVLSVILFLLLVPLGFIPAILYAIVLIMMKPGREQYEVHLTKLKNGRLIQEPNKVSVTSASMSDEIGKLHALFKSGALTQEEFDQEKTKILKKAG